MPPSLPTLGMGLVALGAGAALGLSWSGAPAPAGSAFALARWEGYLGLLWAHLVVLACFAGVTRLGASKAVGPSVQLSVFLDASAIFGTALALALHGSGALWPLAFLLVGKCVVSGVQWLGLRRPLAAAVVWAYAAAALVLNCVGEGGGSAAFWCERLLGGAAAASRCAPLAASLDAFSGVAPTHWTVGVAFRYVLMRYISWALDILSGRVVEATRADAIDRAYSNRSVSVSDDGGDGEASSPRIGAVGGSGRPDAAAGFSFAPPSPLEALSGPDSPQKVHSASTAAPQSSTWAAFLSYALFPPLYLAGPILTASDFYQQAAAAAAGRHTTRALSGRAWWRAAARLAGCALFCEALRRSLFADAAAAALLAAQPWLAWPVGFCVLTALFAQSFVPWTVARLSAGAVGICTPDEAPVGWLRSSATPRAFWRNWHVSWYRWLCHYVYVPCGGGPAALLLTLAVSAALHGGSRAWLVWGGLQALALLTERALAHRPLPGASSLHPHLRAALAQCATLSTLLVQLPLGASLPAFLLCFHAVNLPFCVLNAARLAARGRAGKGDDSPGKRFAALLSAKTAGKAGGKAGGKAAARAQKAAWE